MKSRSHAGPTCHVDTWLPASPLNFITSVSIVHLVIFHNPFQVFQLHILFLFSSTILFQSIYSNPFCSSSDFLFFWCYFCAVSFILKFSINILFWHFSTVKANISVKMSISLQFSNS